MPAGVLVLVTVGCLRAAPAQRLNVVLFVTDDVGLDAGCYGNSAIHTPHLDALAAAGMRFDQARCTTASCSPSRAVIQTGLQSHANGQYGLAHAAHNFNSRPEVKTLPTLLRDAGYRTARYGRMVHVKPWDQYAHDITEPEQDGDLTLADRLYGRNIVECVDNTEPFIVADDDRPFFLMVATCDSHRFGTHFDDLPFRPNTFSNDHSYEGVDEVHYAPEDVQVPGYLSDTPATRAELAQYYQSISRLDQGLGRLVTMLKRTGHWENTVIIFTADHGPPFPGGKTTAYEPGLRVPLVIRDPTRGDAGSVTDALVSLVDITPTILDYAGVSLPKLKLQGRSLLPLLTDPAQAGWDEFYASHTFHEVTMYYPMRVVIEGRLKLIMNLADGLAFPFAQDLWDSSTWQSILADKNEEKRLGQRLVSDFLRRPRFELYDLRTDPYEVRNLALEPSRQADLQRLQDKLRAFQHATNDPWEMKWDRE